MKSFHFFNSCLKFDFGFFDFSLKSNFVFCWSVLNLRKLFLKTSRKSFLKKVYSIGLTKDTENLRISKQSRTTDGIEKLYVKSSTSMYHDIQLNANTEIMVTNTRSTRCSCLILACPQRSSLLPCLSMRSLEAADSQASDSRPAKDVLSRETITPSLRYFCRGDAVIVLSIVWDEFDNRLVDTSR